MKTKKKRYTWRWIYECVWDISLYINFVYKQTNNLNWFILHWKQWTGTWESALNFNENENVCPRVFFVVSLFFSTMIAFVSHSLRVCLPFGMHFPCSQSIFPCSWWVKITWMRLRRCEIRSCVSGVWLSMYCTHSFYHTKIYGWFWCERFSSPCNIKCRKNCSFPFSFCSPYVVVFEM